MRLALFGAVSTILTIYTLINAYIRRGQFFSTCIYISHSNASILVIIQKLFKMKFNTINYLYYFFMLLFFVII